MTTALDKRKPIHTESQVKPGSRTTSMSTRSVTAKKRPSSLGPVTTAVSTPLAKAKRSHSSPGLVTRDTVPCLANDRKCPTAMGIQLATTSKNELPSSMVLNENDQSLSGSGTTTMATGLAGQITAPTVLHLVASKKSQSLTSPVITAQPTQLAVTSRSQPSFFPITKDLDIPLTGATTGQSPSVPHLVASKKSQSLTGPVITAPPTQLAVTSRSQPSFFPITNDLDIPLTGATTGQSPSVPHFVASKINQSLTSPVITAPPTQLAVTSRSQPSFFPITKDLGIPLTGATTGQSPSVATTNMKHPATETINMEIPVTKKMARKRRPTCKDMSPEKQRRFSVRLTEGSSKFKDIVVRKKDGFTHIFLSTKSSENNSLNPEVIKEVQIALDKAAADDSKLVLLSAIGSVFCSGLDFDYFRHHLIRNKKRGSTKMAEAVKNFVNAFIQFKKPIIAAVNGPAIGLGASILPLCDIVWANEKAWFQTPYTTFGQSPDGCSSFTFPKIMGHVSASEMLLGGRKLTAQEALEKGLVSQVFWPQTFNQEIMIRVKELTSCNAVVLEASKALLRFNTKLDLEQTIERECTMLKNIWGSAQGIDDLLKYLQKKIEF